MKWAHGKFLHTGFQASVGQLELISDICVFTLQANARIFLSSSAAAGTRVSYSSPLYAGWANVRPLSG